MDWGGGGAEFWVSVGEVQFLQQMWPPCPHRGCFLEQACCVSVCVCVKETECVCKWECVCVCVCVCKCVCGGSPSVPGCAQQVLTPFEDLIADGESGSVCLVVWHKLDVELAARGGDGGRGDLPTVLPQQGVRLLTPIPHLHKVIPERHTPTASLARHRQPQCDRAAKTHTHSYTPTQNFTV